MTVVRPLKRPDGNCTRGFPAVKRLAYLPSGASLVNEATLRLPVMSFGGLRCAPTTGYCLTAFQAEPIAFSLIVASRCVRVALLGRCLSLCIVDVRTEIFWIEVGLPPRLITNLTLQCTVDAGGYFGWMRSTNLQMAIF
jgi:hypothetical protein